MKMYLIWALSLSLGLCDKLDRTYLPPEGSHQSSGNPGELELPYEDNESKDLELGIQQIQGTEHTDNENLPKQHIMNSKNINPYGFQNTPNHRGKFGNEKQISADNFDNNQRIIQMTNNIPFESHKMPVFRTNIANINSNDDGGSVELNPYLPLTKQVNPGAVPSFETINSSGKLNPFNNYNKNNIEKIIKLPNNVNVFDAQNMFDGDLSHDFSINPAGNSEGKSETKSADTNFDGNKSPPQENVYITYSGVLNQEEPRSQTSIDVHKSNGSPNKDYKTLQTRPPRPQAENDRNAEIISYENFISPEDGKFAFSFDTSNGIHVDEHGTSNDGVKAEGGYSYTGDDGKVYAIRYTADENGFQPTGDHLPTPPPIPEAILRVIELAMKNKENGVSEDNGLYDDNKYGYQNYDHSFASKSKKPHLKEPLSTVNYESTPEREQTASKTQVNFIGNKESEPNADSETMKSFDASDNINNVPNVHYENNRQTSIENRPNMPTFSRNIVQQPPFFTKTEFVDQSRRDIVTKGDNERRPFADNLKNTSEREFDSSDGEKSKASFPLDIDLEQGKKYELNPSNKVEPQLSFFKNNNFNNKQNHFNTHTNDPGLLNLGDYENSEYNAPELQKFAQIVNPNQNINENNPRKNVMKDKYNTEPKTGYQYPAPTRTFIKNPDISNLNTNFQQQPEISDSKPQSGNKLKAAENRRPITNGNNRPAIEETDERAIIRPETTERFPSKLHVRPSSYKNENNGKTENLQTLPKYADLPEKNMGTNVISPNYAERNHNKEGNMPIVLDNINIQQSNKAGGNTIPGGQDFSDPQQKPYFDPKTGYYY